MNLKAPTWMDSTARFVVPIAVASLLIVGGCRKPPVAKETITQPAYDPLEDPNVNPASLFESAPEDHAKIATDDTLFLELEGSPNTLHPFFVSSLYDFVVVDTLYTGLFSVDKNMQWKVNDELVAKFEESEDHTEFVVTMKPGFAWQDGKPLTAHDVVYSWAQILDPQVPCLTQKPSTEHITECVALDDLTVKFVQPEPLATARWNLSFPIIPKHIFEKDKEAHPDLLTGEYYTRQARNPVGSGPYRLVEWKENDKIVVERWEGYQGKKPYFKRIVFRIIPDTNLALLTFEKESIDAIRRLTPQQYVRETNTEAFREIGCKGWAPQWNYAYIGWNMDGSNPFFADRRVRHAMTHALNIQLIIDKVYYGLVTQSHGIFSKGSWACNPNIELLDYDLDKAAKLLDEAGWTVDPDDGWRYRDIQGQKVRFEFTLLIPQGSETSPKVAAIFQEDLKRIGVELKTRLLEWATFLEKIRNHEFQAEIAMWGAGADPDSSYNIWHSSQYAKGRNYGGYNNPRVDELFEQGRREFDQDKRARIYQEIQKILYEEQPYTWVHNEASRPAFNKRLHGVQFSPRGIYGFDPSFYEWWTRPGNARAVAAP